jgi:hypothetical protein
MQKKSKKIDEGARTPQRKEKTPQKEPKKK